MINYLMLFLFPRYMNKFEKLLHKLDKEAESANNPNWVSMTQDTIGVLTSIIEQEEQLGNIYKGKIVLDLGSGNGTAAFTWAHEGYNTIGIEIDPKLYKASIDAQKKYPELERLGVKFYNGSFYPTGYEKTDKTRKLEQEIIREYRSSPKKIKPYFIPFTDTIYADNNIELKDIDIFYAFIWPFQMPSIFEMFHEYARKDAKLIAIGQDIDRILTHYPELKKTYNTITKKSV